MRRSTPKLTRRQDDHDLAQDQRRATYMIDHEAKERPTGGNCAARAGRRELLPMRWGLIPSWCRRIAARQQAPEVEWLSASRLPI